MKFKKVIAIFMGAALILTGCGGGGKSTSINTNKSEIPMGRYVETVLDIPIDNKTETINGFIKEKDGTLAIYSSVRNESEKVTGILKYTIDKDGNWTKQEPNWLNELVKANQDIYFNKIILGQDGNYYACYSENNNLLRPHLLKSADELTSEEIAIYEWDKIESYGYYPNVTGITVAQNGGIGVSYYDNAKLYNPFGELIAQMESSMQGSTLAASADKIYTLNSSGNAILAYDSLSGKKLSEVPVVSSGSMNLTAEIDGTLLLENTEGIHRLVNGGSTWETIVDGEMASMSMPTLYGSAPQKGETDKIFYVKFSSSDGINQLMKYTYDENVAAVPSVELSIYSLEESPTIRQAVSEFQRSNQDVKINFRVADSAEGATTKADNIRTLNTELLAGKGPDVIVLDGMPINSYIEKGVLEDISSIVKEMNVLPNISNGFQSDGKIYAVPTRIGIPVLFARQSEFEYAQNFATLEELAKKGEVPVLSLLGNELVTKAFALSYNQLMDKEGSIDKEKLSAFLTNTKMISAEAAELKTVKSGTFSNTPVPDMKSDSMFDFAAGKSLVGIDELLGIQKSIISMSIAEKENAQLQIIDDNFIPHCLVGINQKSEKKEAAKEFVKLLLSDSVQGTDLYDGFPVSQSSIEIWNGIERNYSLGFSSKLEDGSDYSVTAEWPNLEKRKELTGLCFKVKTPALGDDGLLEMILSETDAFFKGEKTADETAQTIADKAKAYSEQ